MLSLGMPILEKNMHSKTYKISLTVIIFCFSMQLCNGQSNKDSLFIAIDSNDTALVNRLIHRGHSPNQVYQSGWVEISPLIYAIQKRRTNAIQTLIEKKADLNWKDSFNTTALMYAASDGQESIVKMLLDKGADATIKDKQGNDALSAAKESKNIRIIELIKQAQKKQLK
jgi:ankyrin repeat protein